VCYRVRGCERFWFAQERKKGRIFFSLCVAREEETQKKEMSRVSPGEERKKEKKKKKKGRGNGSREKRKGEREEKKEKKEKKERENYLTLESVRFFMNEFVQPLV
jgi:hypothetical protein